MSEVQLNRPRRRRNGDGTVFLQGRLWWFAYRVDGKRKSESSKSTRRKDAERLLRDRLSRIHTALPVIAKVEQFRFEDAARAMKEDFENSGKKSGAVVERRIRLHLQPYFGGRRLVSITPDVVRSYVTKRRADSIVVRKARVERLPDGTERRTPEQRKPVSNGEINRELQILKRIFSIAVKDGKLATKPHIAMLREDNVRTGFFEPHEYTAVLRHLPADIRPVITFAYVTGCRIASEVLPLEWRQVDFEAGEVRLDAGTTKNGEGRVFPFTAELRRILETQKAAHDALKKAGHIAPWVFFRMLADGRGGVLRPQPIRAFTVAWRNACRAAGCPGRIPHDLRRTAVRNLVRAGVPERVAMRLTGHKTPSVFARYDITSPSDLREAANKLNVATAAMLPIERRVEGVS